MYSWLATHQIAHRGLFSRGTEREENTLAAIIAAVDAGYGCEMDVRITGDHQIVVFHDATLDRLTSASGAVDEISYSVLQTIHVGASGQPMPLLSAVLSAIKGRRALIIEIKTEGTTDIEALGRALLSVLEPYSGHFAVMSFDPRIILWFKKNAEHVCRGMVLEIKGHDMPAEMDRHRLLCDETDADFISHDIRTLPTDFTQRWREAGKPVLCWTVRTPEDEAKALQYTDAMTFEPPAVTG